MKNIFKILGMLFLLGCWSGCTKDATNEEQAAGNLMTRSGALNTTDYYWYQGEKIGLNRDNTKKFLLFEASEATSLTRSSSIQFAQQPQTVNLSSAIRTLTSTARATSLPMKDLMWATVTSSLPQNLAQSIIYEAPFFTTSTGIEVGLSHLFYVKLKQESDIDGLISLAMNNRVEIIGNNDYMPLWYTLACTNESAGNALEMANKFFETGNFAACQPDLMCDDILYAVVNDPLYSSQWHLRNTGTLGVDINFENARTISQGSENVIVAVVDQGVQLDHPDLNIHTVSYDSETGTKPSKMYGDHGTRCSGFIAAKTNNNLGVASIVPVCKVMSVSNSLYATPDSRQKRGDAINFAYKNGAAVITNSWGSAVQYQIIDDAISDALTKGRSGKGSVVVFASGNDYDSSVAYPANCNSDILAVGAIGSSGSRASFSNYGSALDVVAPGQSVSSTDIDSDYIHGISGTSFACPIVAGVAALVISVNPELTQKQVAEIIESTARKCGDYSYATQSGYPNGTWNNQMGYGLVDAYAAALKAQEMDHNNDLHLTNKTFSDFQSFMTYKWAYLENVHIQQGGKLIIEAGNGIKITEPFSVHADAQYIMRQTL